MSRPHICPPKTSRYYKRHRPLLATIDGQEQTVSMITTRYSYGQPGRRPAKGPRGGKAYREFWRNVYYFKGTFYTMRNCYDGDANLENGRDEFTWVAVPLSRGVIFDVHEEQTLEQGKALPVESITLDEDGRPSYAFTMGDSKIDLTTWNVADFEAMFDLA